MKLNHYSLYTRAHKECLSNAMKKTKKKHHCISNILWRLIFDLEASQ